MEQNEKLQIVMQKLRKLQKLYEGAKSINSEGEAQAAAAAIQRLLTQYNLTMEEVGEEVNPDAICEERISGYNGKTHGGDWVQKLTSVLCRHNFCRCYYFGNGNKVLLIVGKKENIEIVKWMRDMLMEKYVKLGTQRYKEYIKAHVDDFQYLDEMGIKHEQLSRKNPFLRRYLLGCASGLEAKLREEENKDRVADENLGTKVTSLIVRNDAAITEFMSQKYKKIGSRTSRGLSYTDATRQGYMDGKNTDLYKPIADNRQRNLSNVALLG